jgi:hypothetical protein
MNSDLTGILVALALIYACAWFAIATAQPPKRERHSRPKRRVRPAPFEVSGAAPPPEAAMILPAGPLATRARIFTGESTLPTATKPATKRALKLVVGITALAAAGAIALLAFVGAMVKMFQGIGG